MIEINTSEFKLPPLGPYQVDGIKHIIKKPFAALFDEMGVGKTYQVINAACVLYNAKEIDTIIIVAPASVRGVWDDPETGGIKKFCWVPFYSQRYWVGRQVIEYPPNRLNFITIGYDFLRARLAQFLKDAFKHGTRNVLLCLDESSYVKSKDASRTKACKELSKYCQRRTILNGTPIANSLMDYWAQMDILDPESIFNWPYYKMRHKICIMGGWERKQIVGYEGVTKKEDGTIEIDPTSETGKLLDHMGNWIIRREKKDVLKYLPPKNYNTYEVELDSKSWATYKQMRDIMIAYLESEKSVAVNGAVASIRLSQITSGFIGGLNPNVLDLNAIMEKVDDLPKTKEIHKAKLVAFFDFLSTSPRFPLVVWCRFRAEMERLINELTTQDYRVGYIYGGQKDQERQDFINNFQEGNLDIMVGQVRAGGLGITLHKSSTVVYMSNDYSLIAREQSEDRVHRPGQENPCNYYDFIAKGPGGQRTIDSIVLKSLREKRSMMEWSTQNWKEELLA